MDNSQNSLNFSQNDPMQLPLPGFKIEVNSPKKGWRKFIETTLSGRTRIHMTKKR